MALITCELDGITGVAGCTKKKGVRRAFFAQSSLIDWPAMLADPSKFDPAAEQVLGYTYLAGGKHVEIEYERRTGQFDATFTGDQGYYDVLFQMIMLGKDRTRTNALKRLAVCCDLSIHLFLSDGSQRVIGIDYDGEVFDRPLDKFDVARHLDSAGAFDGDDARDEIDIQGQQEFAPLFASVPVSELVLSAAGAVNTAYGPNAGGTDGFGPAADGDDVYGPVGGPVEAEAVAATEKKGTKAKAKTLKA